jgi:hypothetical protein
LKTAPPSRSTPPRGLLVYERHGASTNAKKEIPLVKEGHGWQAEDTEEADHLAEEGENEDYARTMLDRVRSIIRVISTKWRDLLFQYEQRKIAKSGCGSFSAKVRPD